MEYFSDQLNFREFFMVEKLLRIFENDHFKVPKKMSDFQRNWTNRLVGTKLYIHKHKNST